MLFFLAARVAGIIMFPMADENALTPAAEADSLQQGYDQTWAVRQHTLDAMKVRGVGKSAVLAADCGLTACEDTTCFTGFTDKGEAFCPSYGDRICAEE